MRRLIFVLLLFPTSIAAQTYARWDWTVQNAVGQAINGAVVSVYTESGPGQPPGALAILYANANGAASPLTCGVLSGTGNQISNPLTTDGFGSVCAYLAAGVYTVCYASPYIGNKCYNDQSVPGGNIVFGTQNSIAGFPTPTNVGTATNLFWNNCSTSGTLGGSLCIPAIESGQDSPTSATSKSSTQVNYTSAAGGVYDFNGVNGTKSNRSALTELGSFSTFSQNYGVGAYNTGYSNGEVIGLQSYVNDIGGYGSPGFEGVEGLKIEMNQVGPACLASSTASCWQAVANCVNGSSGACSTGQVTFNAPSANGASLGENRPIRDIGSKVNSTDSYTASILHAALGVGSLYGVINMTFSNSTGLTNGSACLADDNIASDNPAYAASGGYGGTGAILCITVAGGTVTNWTIASSGIYTTNTGTVPAFHYGTATWATPVFYSVFSPTLITDASANFSSSLGVYWTSTILTGMPNGTHAVYGLFPEGGALQAANLLFCPVAGANDGYDSCVPILYAVSSTSFIVMPIAAGTQGNSPWPWSTATAGYAIYRGTVPTAINTSTLQFSSCPSMNNFSGSTSSALQSFCDLSGITNGDTLDQPVNWASNYIGINMQLRKSTGPSGAGGAAMVVTNENDATAPAISGIYMEGTTTMIGGECALAGCFSEYIEGDGEPTVAMINDSTTSSNTFPIVRDKFSDGVYRQTIGIDKNLANNDNLILLGGAVTIDASGNVNSTGQDTSLWGCVWCKYTNLMLDAEFQTVPGGSTWTAISSGSPGAATITANNGTDPWGNTTAETVALPTLTGTQSSGQQQAISGVTTTSGQPITVVMSMKSSTANTAIAWNISLADANCHNLPAKTIGTSLAPVIFQCTPAGTGNAIVFGWAGFGTAASGSTITIAAAQLCLGASCGPIAITGSTAFNGVVSALTKGIPQNAVFNGSGASAIPSCGALYRDAREIVTDGAATPTFYGAYSAGAGSVRVPVYCNGSGWVYE